jgi:hypothetical protein
MSLEAKKEVENEFIRQQTVETEQAKKKQEQEKAEKLIIENELRRGQYVSREKVKTLFGRVFAVHSNILQPLSLKLSSMLAAVPPGDKKEATMKKMIEDEIYAALGSIQRLLIEFVTGQQ